MLKSTLSGVHNVKLPEEMIFKMAKGWHGESKRHRDARNGIKTAKDNSKSMAILSPKGKPEFLAKKDSNKKYWRFPKGEPAPNNYVFDGVGWLKNPTIDNPSKETKKFLKDLTHKQLERKGINLHDNTDSDGDGLVNSKDCRPLDKTKQDNGKPLDKSTLGEIGDVLSSPKREAPKATSSNIGQAVEDAKAKVVEDKEEKKARTQEEIDLISSGERLSKPIGKAQAIFEKLTGDDKIRQEAKAKIEATLRDRGSDLNQDLEEELRAERLRLKSIRTKQSIDKLKEDEDEALRSGGGLSQAQRNLKDDLNELKEKQAELHSVRTRNKTKRVEEKINKEAPSIFGDFFEDFKTVAKKAKKELK